MNRKIFQVGNNIMVMVTKTAIELFPARAYLKQSTVHRARREWMRKSIYVRYGSPRLMANRAATLRMLGVVYDTLGE